VCITFLTLDDAREFPNSHSMMWNLSLPLKHGKITDPHYNTHIMYKQRF